MIINELRPHGNQKSYYGKAKLLYCDNYVTKLVSYDTIVAEWHGGEFGAGFVRTWSGYSVTTMRHVNSFRALWGLPVISKKEWLSMEVH